jgi:ABC-type uncharacterized transport system substrate-binding protein
MTRRPLLTRLLAPSVLAPLLLAAHPAGAHPHLFVDVTHTLLFDPEGRLVGLRARWDYDEMFTLLMVEDGGYDSDGDGRVAGDELAAFQHWDADWPEDYGGDVELVFEGHPVPLRGPGDWAAEWSGGRAVSVHTRMLRAPLDPAGGELVIRPYDPDFYTAYTIAAAPRFEGRSDCRAELFEADTGAISDELAAAIAELSPETTPADAGLPAVGRLYADEERIRCGR